MLTKIAAVLIAATPFAANAAQSVINGDFEAGLTGFTATSGVQVASGMDYVLGAGGSGSPAAQANHFAAFGGGNVPGVETLSQSFTTVAGRTYNVSFQYGAFNATSEQLVYALTGTPGATLSSSGTSNLDSLFTSYTTSFVGTGAATTISFTVAAQAGDNADIFLDSVSVASVPEPAVWGLMIAGFGMVGFAARRRQSAVTA